MRDGSPAAPGLPSTSRRDFLGLSLGASAALYVGSAAAVLTLPGSANASEAGYEVLREVDAAYFSVMLPAVIAQARDPQASEVFLRSFDRMLNPASEHTVHSVRQLVDLLTSDLTRPLMTFRWADWPDLPVADRVAVLESWRDSAFEIPRAAYQVTTSLTRTAWYMVPEHQAISGYPGPPKKIVG